ncbi:MAG: hypothetical protein ACAI34_22620 [Verrucomicrobium sp.]
MNFPNSNSADVFVTLSRDTRDRFMTGLLDQFPKDKGLRVGTQSYEGGFITEFYWEDKDTGASGRAADFTALTLNIHAYVARKRSRQKLKAKHTQVAIRLRRWRKTNPRHS